MKTLVVYYSKTGNTRYLATRLAAELGADVEEIRPRMNSLPALMLFSLLGTGPGIRKLKYDPAAYGRVILCGPIWVGQLVAPLRSFIGRYRKAVRKLYFACTCGSGDADRGGKFGYDAVFAKVRAAAGDVCAGCEAFSVKLVVPEGMEGDDGAVMKARFDDANFSGEIRARFDAFTVSLGKP